MVCLGRSDTDTVTVTGNKNNQKQTTQPRNVFETCLRPFRSENNYTEYSHIKNGRSSFLCCDLLLAQSFTVYIINSFVAYLFWFTLGGHDTGNSCESLSSVKNRKSAAAWRPSSSRRRQFLCRYFCLCRACMKIKLARMTGKHLNSVLTFLVEKHRTTLAF